MAKPQPKKLFSQSTSPALTMKPNVQSSNLIKAKQANKAVKEQYNRKMEKLDKEKYRTVKSWNKQNWEVLKTYNELRKSITYSTHSLVASKILNSGSIIGSHEQLFKLNENQAKIEAESLLDDKNGLFTSQIIEGSKVRFIDVKPAKNDDTLPDIFNINTSQREFNNKEKPRGSIDTSKDPETFKRKLSFPKLWNLRRKSQVLSSEVKIHPFVSRRKTIINF